MIQRLLALILIALMLLQSGCWNRRELEDVGLVMMMSIDKNDQGQYEVYFGVIKPALLRTQGGGEASERAAITLRGVGKTIFEAIRVTLTESTRKLFFGQMFAVVITEKALEDQDIGDIMDIFLRDHEFRRSIKIFVTPNSGEDVLGAQPEIENTVGKEIASIVEQSKASGFFPNITINDFTKTLASDVPNPVAPLLYIKEGIQQRRLFEEKTDNVPQVIYIDGAAAFSGEAYVGQLDKNITRGVLFATDKIKNTVFAVPSNDIKEKPLSVEIVKSKTTIEPKLEGELPSITIKVKVDANLAGNMGDTDYSKEENLKTLEKQTAKAIEGEIQKAIDKAQLDLRVDIFGFGNDIYRKYKDYWKEHKEDWVNIFPDIKITTDIEVKLRRMGLETKPLCVD